jgi:GNAT superfamily N-acetyltransferase
LSYRQPIIDDEIDISSIRNPILLSLLQTMDSFVEVDNGQRCYYFCDIQNRFFCAMTEPIARYEHVMTEEDYAQLAKDLEGGYKTGALGRYDYITMTVPVLKVVFVPPTYRGRNIQKRFFEYLTDVADETNTCFAAFADPFYIPECPHRCGAKEALAFFCHNGYEEPDNYWTLSVKQRNRFIESGLRNVEYANAEVTQPWQHFFYLHCNATPEEHRLISSLERRFDVDLEKIEEIEGRT